MGFIHRGNPANVMLSIIFSGSVQQGPQLLLPDGGHGAPPIHIQDPQRGPPIHPQGHPPPHMQLVPQPPGELLSFEPCYCQFLL